jgi:hypothetical protein
MNRRLKRIDELAKDIPPSRDLWPAIAAAIDAEKASAAPQAKQPVRRAAWMPAVGLAASVALVAVGVFIGKNLGTQPSGLLAGTHQPQNGNPVANPLVIPAALRDAEYRQQRDALLVEAQAKLKTMPTAERDKVAASLATLQRSISEIEAALGRDPANALLQELLVNSCQEQMRALTAVRDSGREEI